MTSNRCNRFFKPGKLTICMDGGAGSSGKGKLASYVTENADNWTFACNAFAPQAGHWVRLDDGSTYFYRTLNGCAYNFNKYEKLYIGPGATLELPALFREIQENHVPDHKLGISPLALILEDFDAEFERGEKGFDNTKLVGLSDGTMRTGSTCHGVGSAAARRVLRRASVRTAKDIPELQKYLCDVPGEITSRLDRGESGLLELAQGFQLSLLHTRFAPHTTSRQVTVAQGMSDMFLAPKYAGQVILNFRTYPIRINSKKFIGEDGKHLTWAEVEAGIPHTVYEGNSGGWYPDQHEVDWDYVTKAAESPTKLIEITSVTKLPRRVATFSLENVREAIKYNDTGNGVHLSINFANYVDYAMSGATQVDQITTKMSQWLIANLGNLVNNVMIIGTGPKTSETISLKSDENIWSML
jgi:adenylosuccinate synthase